MTKSREAAMCVAVAFTTLLIVGTDLFVISPLLPQVAAAYGVSAGTAGFSVVAFSIAYTVCAPVLGVLADRLGRRRVLIVALMLFGLANAGTAWAPTFGLLVAARVVAGVAASGITPAVMALVGQIAPPARRGTWMSIALAGFLISLTVGAPAGTAVAAGLGWRAPFAGLALLAAALAVLNRIAAPAAPPVRRGPSGPRVPAMRKVRAVSGTGIWAFAVYAFYTYLGAGLHQRGMGSSAIAVTLAGYGAGAVAGSLGGGRLADRFGAARVATASLLLLAGALLAVDLLIRAPAVVTAVALGMFALVAHPFLPAYQSRLVADHSGASGTILAWNSCLMYLGTSAGAAAGGWMLSTVGFRAIPVMSAAAAVGWVVLCARAVFASGLGDAAAADLGDQAQMSSAGRR